MSVLNMKRVMMFTWIGEEELEWLFFLRQFETCQEELEIDSIVDGVWRLEENQTVENIKRRDKALLGLVEERLIKMNAEYQDGLLSIDEIYITQRGRKVLEEAEAILGENEDTLDVMKELKKAERKEKTLELVLNTGTSFACGVLHSIFTA